MSKCCEPGNPMPDVSIDAMGEGRVAASVDDAAMTLADLPVGKSAIICQVGGEGSLRQHFLDMGLIPNAPVTMVKHAPMGDPVQVRIHGYELSLRLANAEKITVTSICGNLTDLVAYNAAGQASPVQGGVFPGGHPHEADHPGLGEGGRYHDRTVEPALPEGTQLTFVLVGNHNSGKTALFNQLTGSNLHVGNFPGVTVDSEEALLRGHKDVSVVDLPGLYSMSPFSSEELVARQYVLEQKPNCIINVVDATNIERNLCLTMQLLELDIPMVVALNMIDEVIANSGSVLVNELEAQLGVPVVPVSAQHDEGVAELVDHALHVAR